MGAEIKVMSPMFVACEEKLSKVEKATCTAG